MPQDSTRAALNSATVPRRNLLASPAVKTYVCLAAAHAMVDCFSSAWSIFKTLAGLDLAFAGLLATIGSLIASIMQPIFGAVADHGYRRRFVLLGCVLASFMMLLGPISMTDDFMHSTFGYALMFFVILVGWLGVGMFHPSGVSLAGDTLGARRSTVVALFVACGMMGLSSGHLLFSFLFLELDRHTEILMIPMGLVVLWVWRWCRVTESRPRGGVGIRSLTGRLTQVPIRLIPLWVILVMISAHQQGMIFLMPDLAIERGFGEFYVRGGAFGAFIVGAAVMAVPVGHLADRFGRRRVIILCLLLCTPLHFVVVMTTGVPAWLCLPMLFLVGGLAGAAGPVGVAHGQHLLPGHVSLISGLLMGFAWAAASPIQWTVGSLAKQPAWGPSGALVWLGASLVIAVVSACFVPGSLGQTGGGDPA